MNNKTSFKNKINNIARGHPRLLNWRPICVTHGLMFANLKLNWRQEDKINTDVLIVYKFVLSSSY